MELKYSGKVRDIYTVGSDLLLVASDRISALDVILPQPIPEKGRVLTGITAFWLEKLRDVAPNHLITADPAKFPEETHELEDIAGRAMLVKRAEMLPIECIVRGYLSGSAYREYEKSGTMHGEPLPAGMKESVQLPEPVFTPSTKAEQGKHDENISFEQAAALIGPTVAERAREIALNAYQVGAAWARERGIIIADTKFELGFIDGELAICDEVLTPDSSRFWSADVWEPGSTPPSYDKQPVRDWLASTGWELGQPAPDMGDDVIKATMDRYVSAYETLTQSPLSSWFGAEK